LAVTKARITTKLAMAKLVYVNVLFSVDILVWFCVF
jgi:hypothetical protein